MQNLIRKHWNLGKIENGIKYVEKFGLELYPDFIVDSENVATVKRLIKYFNGYEDFELTSGAKGDLTKGLLIVGESGTGKTMLMRIFAKYCSVDEMYFIADGTVVQMKNFDIKPTITIVSEFERDGFDTIEKYARQRIVCFDDLGIEMKESVYYGARLNVMEQILLRRYYNNVLTMATSNYTLSTLSEMYGPKVLSRIYEMFNILVLSGPDRRIRTIKFSE